MNPDDMLMKLAGNVQLLGAFNELLQKAKTRLPSDLAIGGKRFDRLCKRGVEILRALRTQDPKCYDDLQFVDEYTAFWAFLYAQSGTPINECARVLRTQARKAARGAQPPPTWSVRPTCSCRLCRLSRRNAELQDWPSTNERQ